MNGYNVKMDLVKAAEWYKKAVDQGDAQSQYYLG